MDNSRDNNLEEYNPHRPEINRSVLANSSRVNALQTDFVSFTSTNNNVQLTIKNLKPESPQKPINVRVLHRWQNGKGPVKFLFSDATGWIDANCWPRDYMENAVNHASVLKVNHCYTIKTWQVNNIERDYKEDYFSSFSDHNFIMDITKTAFTDIIPCNLEMNTDFLTYMPFKLHDLKQVVYNEPELGTCAYQFDTVGIIVEVTDHRNADLTDYLFKEITLKCASNLAVENTVTCRIYGAHTYKIDKNDVGKMLVLKNAKVEKGRLILSESISFVFKISNNQDAEIFSAEQKNEYYESIAVLSTRKRSSDNNEIANENKKIRTTLQPSDFQHYNICAIKNLTTNLTAHSMTDVFITLENVLMTVSMYEYLGCKDCSTKVKVSKICPKCGIPTHNAVIYPIAGNIDLYQGNDHLGNIKTCFRDLALQINTMKNEERRDILKPGLVCKIIPFIKLHGTKKLYEKNWRYEVKSIVDYLEDSQNMEDFAMDFTNDVLEEQQLFEELKPLVVNVKLATSSTPKPNKAKNYPPLHSPPKGAVLILSHQKYYFDEKGYPDYNDKFFREFAEVDEDNVKELCYQLEYDVTIKHDLLVSDLDDVLNDFKNRVISLNADVALIFMMSHGTNDHFFMADGYIHIWQDVVYKFTNTAFPQMNGKPKGFFIQACRDFLHKSPNIKEQISLPINEQPWDILVSFSTAPGFPSQRFETGTIYIYKLVEVLMNNSYKDDVMAMLTDLKIEMAKFKEGQVTLEFNSLTKKLFLQ